MATAAAAAIASGLAWAGATPVPDVPRSVLDAFGPQAAHIAQLWRTFVIACSLVFGAVLALLLFVVWRSPGSREPAPADRSGIDPVERGPARGVVAAVAGATLLLMVLIAASFFTNRAVARLSLGDAVTIEVTAHQRWWTVRYLDGPPSDQVETVNEIHVPVGRPVVVRLKSDDVIHSLWVPKLAGKKDLIPGRTALMTFRADTPGVYRGQCAEFCGDQHATMVLSVVAQPPAQFEQWLARQRALSSLE